VTQRLNFQTLRMIGYFGNKRRIRDSYSRPVQILEGPYKGRRGCVLRSGVHSTTGEAHLEVLLSEDERMSMCNRDIVQVPHKHVQCLWLHDSAPVTLKTNSAAAPTIYSNMPSIVAKNSSSDRATLFEAQPSPSTLPAPAKYMSRHSHSKTPSTLCTGAPSPASPDKNNLAIITTSAPSYLRAQAPAVAQVRAPNISPSVHKVKEASRPVPVQHCDKRCQHDKRKTRCVTLSTLFKFANENLYRCKICGGGSLCEHGRQKGWCLLCKTLFHAAYYGDDYPER